MTTTKVGECSVDVTPNTREVNLRDHSDGSWICLSEEEWITIVAWVKEKLS